LSNRPRPRQPARDLVKTLSEAPVLYVLLRTIQIERGQPARGFFGSLVEELKFGEEILRNGLRKTVDHFSGLLHKLNFVYAMLASHHNRNYNFSRDERT